MWRGKVVEEEGCGGGRLWRGKVVEEEGCGGGRLWRRKVVEEEGRKMNGDITINLLMY